MPQIFKVGGYLVYFWTNENDPIEPIHVHIAEGVPTPNATKLAPPATLLSACSHPSSPRFSSISLLLAPNLAPYLTLSAVLV